jgi:hypothetical protein
MKDLLSEAITFSFRNVSDFKFRDKDEKQVYSVAIYCSIIELAQSFFTLIDTKNLTGSLSIYRTFLENYIDLKNLKLHESYENELAFQNLTSMKNSLEEAKKGNKFLTPLKKHAKEKLPVLRADIKQLKTMDDKPLSISKKFKLADMKSEYLGFYPQLCAEAHSSVSAILDRHIEVNNTDDSLEISIFKEKPVDDYYYYLCNMAQHLLDAGVILCEILGDERTDKFVVERNSVKVKAEKHT